MNLITWGRTNCILIYEELEMEMARKKKTKALIVDFIRAVGVDAAKISESLDLAKERQKKRKKEKLEKKERSDRIRWQGQQQGIELNKLDLELKKCPSDGGSGTGSGGGDRIFLK